MSDTDKTQAGENPEGENVTDNPKSWVAWRKETEAMRALWDERGREIDRLNAALSEAQTERDALREDNVQRAACEASAWKQRAEIAAERDALKGEVDRLRDELSAAVAEAEDQRERSYFNAMQRAEEQRDAAVKRAEAWEEDARRYCQNADHHREQREAAERRLSLAERVVEAQDGLLSDLREFGPERIPESRWDDVDAAVAEYRKAVGR